MRLVIAVMVTACCLVAHAIPRPAAETERVEDGRHGAYTLASFISAPKDNRDTNEDLDITRKTEEELQSGDRRRKRAATSSAEAASASVEYLTPGEEDSEADDSEGMSQHFFPSFFPSFGSSRQNNQFYQAPVTQRPALLHRSNTNFQPIGFLHQTAEASDSSQSNLLGSGNFGVIRGGTFYNDADRDHSQASEYDSQQVYSPYYSNNGHGRPSFYKGGGTNPRPQKHGNDFFANFRDFADINTPTKSSYSELYVVYVNKNASRHDQEPRSVVFRGGEKPRNIIEQLALIDREEEPEATVPEKKTKLSPAKLKLARTFKNKREKVKKAISPKELDEPLLALS